jgi:stage V sporulation protein G
MIVTEVRFTSIEDQPVAGEKLLAFCSVTLDGELVIKDMKVLNGDAGMFVSFPSRRIMDRCKRCATKNHLKSRFCNECGERLTPRSPQRDDQGRPKYHADVTHPITSKLRDLIENAIIEAWVERRHAAAMEVA